MKYDNRKAFEKHFQEAAPHHLSSVYFILGKEEEECHDIAQGLIQTLLGEKLSKELALRVFSGAQAAIEEILDELGSLSFFAPKRIIWIQQFDKFKKNALDALEQVLGRLSKSHYLVMTASSLTRTTSFYKAVEKVGVLLDLPDSKPWEKEKRLVEWLNHQASAHRKLMAYPVCQQLVKQVGSDQALLQRELEKLLCFIGDRKEITIEDIRAISTYSSSETVWQLGEAIFRREAATALKIGRALLSEGQPLLPLLRQIRSQFQTDYQICLLVNQGRHVEVTREFPYMKGQILERHLQLSQQYGAERFKQGLLAIDAIEIQSKNSHLDETLLMDILIAKLTF